MTDTAGNTPRNIHLALQYDNQNQAEMRVVARNDEPLTITNSSSAVLIASDIATSYDAFGRHRVSEPFTLFDSSFRYSDNTVKWDTSNVGVSTYTFLPNQGLMNLSVGSSQNDSVIRQTKRVFNYQPGKSLLVLNTFVMEPAKTGLRQRVGYFSSQNGIYLEQDGNTINLVIRKYNSGSVDDNQEKVSQSAWNGDKLDGSGGEENSSGYTLDLSKAQIFWCDIEWLGVGSVRSGFVINGEFIVCHTFHHANLFTSTYMTTASLPVRYEITNTDNTSGGSNLLQICSTVISEGGFASTSRSRAASTSLAGQALSDVNWTPLISIRLKSDRTQGVVFPARLEVYGLESVAYKWAVFVGSTLSNANAVTWSSAGSESFVEYATNATTLTGGYKIDEGMFIGGARGGPTAASPVGQTQDVQLGQLLNGNVEIFTVAALATTNNDKAVATIVWQEYG